MTLIGFLRLLWLNNINSNGLESIIPIHIKTIINLFFFYTTLSIYSLIICHYMFTLIIIIIVSAFLLCCLFIFYDCFRFIWFDFFFLSLIFSSLIAFCFVLFCFALFLLDLIIDEIGFYLRDFDVFISNILDCLFPPMFHERLVSYYFLFYFL